jgi:hypothetical protein
MNSPTSIALWICPGEICGAMIQIPGRRASGMTEKVSLPGYCDICDAQDCQKKSGETVEWGKDEKGTAQPNS